MVQWHCDSEMSSSGCVARSLGSAYMMTIGWDSGVISVDWLNIVSRHWRITSRSEVTVISWSQSHDVLRWIDEIRMMMVNARREEVCRKSLVNLDPNIVPRTERMGESSLRHCWASCLTPRSLAAKSILSLYSLLLWLRLVCPRPPTSLSDT